MTNSNNIIPGNILDELTSIKNSKCAIKTALSSKGISVGDSDPLSAFATKINNVSSSSLFSVNSGNVDSNGAGDLVGEISYDTVSGDNCTYTVLNGNTAITDYTRVGDVLYRGSNPPNGTTLYVIPKETVTSGSSSFDLVTKIHTGSTTAHSSNYYLGWYDSGGNVKTFGRLWYAGTGSTARTPAAYVNVNGTQLAAQSMSKGWKTNSVLYLKFSFSGTRYAFSWSSDGATWTEMVGADSTTINSSTYSYLKISASLGYPDNNLDLSETYLLREGVEVWRAAANYSRVNNMAFKVGNTYSSLVVTNGQGTQFSVEELANQTLQGYPAGTYNIFLTPEGTTYALANTVYIQGTTPTMVTGDVWVNTSSYPLVVTKSGTSGDFTDVPICKVTIEQSGSSLLVTSSETYKYNRLQALIAT